MRSWPQGVRRNCHSSNAYCSPMFWSIIIEKLEASDTGTAYCSSVPELEKGERTDPLAGSLAPLDDACVGRLPDPSGFDPGLRNGAVQRGNVWCANYRDWG